jgi:hypothetical protein
MTNKPEGKVPEMPPQSGDKPLGSERNPRPPQDSLPAGQAKQLTEEDVRRIVRQEAKGIWRHDANHGATQARIASQLSRDEEAGLDYKEPQPDDPEPEAKDNRVRKAK